MKSVKSIFRSNDYDKFAFVPINRGINQGNLKNLMKKIAQKGYDDSLSIIVWIDNRGIYGNPGQWYILDGQHRLIACRELKKSFAFNFKKFENEDTKPVNELKDEIEAYINSDVNNSSKKWNVEDSIDSFVKGGHPFYINLRKLKQSTGLTNTAVLMFLTGDSSISTTAIRKYGKNLKQGDTRFTNECLSLYHQIKGNFRFARYYEFGAPLAKFVENHMNDSQWGKYKSNLIKNASKMTYKISQREWLQQLEDFAKVAVKKMYVNID